MNLYVCYAQFPQQGKLFYSDQVSSNKCLVQTVKKKYRFSVLTSGVFKSRETLQAFRTRKKLLLDLENRAWRVSITFVLCKANNSVYTAVHKYETSNVFALIQLLELPLPFKKQNPNYCCFFFVLLPRFFPWGLLLIYLSLFEKQIRKVENNYFSMDVLKFRDAHQKIHIVTQN